MKLIINTCFGGFSLSNAAYEWLINNGIPRRKYEQEIRDEVTQRYKPQPLNDGEVIFDRTLELPSEESYALSQRLLKTGMRYWDTWIKYNRAHPLVVKCVETLGAAAASGKYAALKVVEIPDDVKYTIEEYDGNEHVAEVHRKWE